MMERTHLVEVNLIGPDGGSSRVTFSVIGETWAEVAEKASAVVSLTCQNSGARDATIASMQIVGYTEKSLPEAYRDAFRPKTPPPPPSEGDE